MKSFGRLRKWDFNARSDNYILAVKFAATRSSRVIYRFKKLLHARVSIEFILTAAAE